MLETGRRISSFLFFSLAVLVCLVLSDNAVSQPTLSTRRTTGGSSSSRSRPETTKGAVSKNLKITKIMGIGSRSMVTAPRYEYRDTGFPGSKGTRRDWARIELNYQTAPDWIDQHSITFYVLMRNKNVPKPKTPEEPVQTEYVLLRGSVSYMLVQKGKHLSDVYIHPSVLERYGDIVAIGAEMSYGDEEVSRGDISSKSGLSKAHLWWREVGKSEKVTSRDGLLLKKSKTPFALVNYWDYDMSRD